VAAKVFNNDKFAEVVQALNAADGAATAQQIATSISVTHDLARKVLLRLVDAGLLKTLPRVGGQRGVLPYEVQPGPEWDALTTLCRLIQAR